MIHLRLLCADELTEAEALMTAAYGPGDRKSRLERYRALQPDGWFVASVSERMVGLGGALNYGSVGYVGLMSVLPEFQRGGIGAAILERTLTWLLHERCPCVLLDATIAGAPLYRKVGFVEDEPTHVFTRAAAADAISMPVGVVAFDSSAVDEVGGFDAESFGADRRRLLSSYLNSFEGMMCRDTSGGVSGYVVVQSNVIGPLVARDDITAARLLDAALSMRSGLPLTFLVVGGNSRAVNLAESRGFSRSRTLSHMRKGGEGPPGHRHRLFGRGSFVAG